MAVWSKVKNYVFLFFCHSNSSPSHCIPGCLHSLQISFSLVVYQVQEGFFFLKGEKKILWHFNLPHLLLGAGELWKHSWHSIMAFSEDFISFGQTKSQITSTLSLGARWSPRKTSLAELCTLSWAGYIADVGHITGKLGDEFSHIIMSYHHVFKI